MNTGEWMIANRIDKWISRNERKQDNRLWYRCEQSECDNRPFYINPSELEDAEGSIECEICGKECSPCDKPEWA